MDRRGRTVKNPHHYQPPHLSRRHGKHCHVSRNTVTRSDRSDVERLRELAQKRRDLAKRRRREKK